MYLKEASSHEETSQSPSDQLLRTDSLIKLSNDDYTIIYFDPLLKSIDHFAVRCHFYIYFFNLSISA
jgi:hypothetical protein